MNKKLIIGLTLVGGLVLLWLVSKSFAGDKGNDLFHTVKKEDFEISVVVSGEIKAKNSVKIKGPSSMREVGLWNVQIETLIPEGTRVKEGDFVASLDKSQLATKLNEAGSKLTQAISEHTQTRLDTALELSAARDAVKNAQFNQREKEITLEQSKFEPPAAIRLAEMNLDKAKRDLERAIEDLEIKSQKSTAKMDGAAASVAIEQNKVDKYQRVIGEFTILAPKDGMLVYKRKWDGTKITQGSEISAWNSTVATLPDLSVILSNTYVNEVDIRKVEEGQHVEISFDAFPDKQLTGKVTEVANVGEQLKGGDAKVFSVAVQISEGDSTVRPGMTTGNRIIADRLESVLVVPLDAIHAQGDSISYVYLSKGMSSKRQQIELGATNEDHAIVVKGLSEGDEIFLSFPEGGDEWDINLLEEID